ncbi:ABC transporter ATP-binding protein [Mesorhizobium sp. CA5]|uniref:ABC transporter ATP-binding protein n=1 Tax=Mesorhizobium sp. CA5 TaxID=2876638 RepID=UPI001CD176C0|nr:ABC transporter ATP-binding protein [Mesorhizobium sp. CA5]MBZ9845830.1 ABC transporter ATP-binding protein [Mesorhizobium sp. CA5]
MSFDRSGAEAGVRNSSFAIRVREVSKHYVMFERPEDRFKQMIVPRLERLVGRPPRRYFRDFAALSDVSFEVGRGETIGIIGRNGSGKSTLLQIVCGTLQPTSGSVEVNGRIAALLELGAGFNPEFTGRENVFLNASILGVPAKEMEWRFDDIVRFADIGPFIDQPVKTYSSGMYVRLAFATAINVDPDILVVDEALAVGDEAFQRKCFARIEQIKERGGTILFVSHGAQTIVQLCSRAILMDSGEKILEGEPKTVVSQYQRLVNASSQTALQLRNAVKDIGQGKAQEITGGGTQLQDPQDEENNLVAEGYDPSFVSKSAIEYENKGAKIHSLRLINKNLKTVNILQSGRRYMFEYKVSYEEDAEDVSFGMLIKTISGIELAGTATNLIEGPKQNISTGSTVTVRMEFDCALTPGVYFINAGTGKRKSGERIMAHRVQDGLMFRVNVQGKATFAGIVDLNIISYFYTGAGIDHADGQTRSSSMGDQIE